MCGPDVLLARAFCTSIEDLDVDFRRETRPELVTRLIVNCVGSGWSQDYVWQWPLPRRTQALLALAKVTRGPRLQVPHMCSAAECRQVMEVDLDFETFRRSREETVFEFSPAAGVRFELRLPTGEDQRRFGSTAADDPLALVRALVVSGNAEQFRSEWLEAAEKALEVHDELTAITLRAACPWCGFENELDFDLEGYLLRDLQKRQASLLDAVHKLARAYHWSEREILNLPQHRREYYLDRIDEEAM